MATDTAVTTAISFFNRPGKDTANQGNPGGAPTIYLEGVHELNASRLKAYGEHIHFNTYLRALSLAGRPVPNNPSATLAGF